MLPETWAIEFCCGLTLVDCWLHVFNYIEKYSVYGFFTV